jgi:hypothetical protein
MDGKKMSKDVSPLETVETRILHWENKGGNSRVVTATDSGTCELHFLLRCIRKAQFCAPEKQCHLALDEISTDTFVSLENSKCKIRVETVEGPRGG